VKFAFVLPLTTVTFGGTPATDELLLDSDTITPPLGAGPLNVTVPREVPPPETLVGFSEIELNVSAGTTVIVTVATLLLFVPSFAT
jgi:hypothetical protein